MEQQIIELTDSDYQSRIEGASGIILFYKKVCPHCKAMKKVIEKVATADPTLTVMQIDSETNPVAMADLDVGRVPTLVLAKNGQVVQRKSGLMNTRELTALIQAS